MIWIYLHSLHSILDEVFGNFLLESFLQLFWFPAQIWESTNLLTCCHPLFTGHVVLCSNANQTTPFPRVSFFLLSNSTCGQTLSSKGLSSQLCCFFLKTCGLWTFLLFTEGLQLQQHRLNPPPVWRADGPMPVQSWVWRTRLLEVCVRLQGLPGLCCLWLRFGWNQSGDVWRCWRSLWLWGGNRHLYLQGTDVAGTALGLSGHLLPKSRGVQEGVKRGSGSRPTVCPDRKTSFLQDLARFTTVVSLQSSPKSKSGCFCPAGSMCLSGTEQISVTTWFLQYLESSFSRISAGRWKWMRGHLSCCPVAPRVVCFLLNRTKHWLGVLGQQFY